MNKLVLFFINFFFCFQVLSSNIKSLDFNPAETLKPSLVRTIKLDDKLIFVTNLDERLKLWRQEEGSEKIEEYFDGTGSYLSPTVKLLRWDNDKFIFWSRRDNEEDSKWYQTDGTKANTHEFHALNKLYEEYSLSSADVLFVTSIDDENVLFFIKGWFDSDYKFAPVKYNKSADTFEILEGFDEDDFGFDGYIARLGNYIFAKNWMGFYRINILDMQVEELIKNDISSRHSSYHFQYAESATTVNHNADPVAPLIDFGFFQIYQDGKFSTHIIDGVSGEILTLPIESEYQFSSKVLQNSHSFYIAVGGTDHLSDSVLYQLKKNDFSLKRIEPQTVKPEECTKIETYSHQADKVTEEGVLVRGTYWCNNQKTLDTLSFVNELSGESHQFNVDNGTLNYTLYLQETSTNAAFYSAYNSSDDKAEVWKVNLSNMEFNRVHIPRYSGRNTSTHQFFYGYSLNDNYYLYLKDRELVSDSNSIERKLVREADSNVYNWGPLLTNKVNTDTRTVDPVHHFSKNVSSVGPFIGDFIETSEGVFLYSDSWVNYSHVGKFYKFEQGYKLSLVAEINIEDIVNLGSGLKEYYYSNVNSQLIYYITENRESNQYYLNSLDLKGGETRQEAELLKDESGRAPKSVIKVEDGYALIAFGLGNVDYLKVDLNNDSQTLFDEVPFSCGAYAVVSGHGVFNSDGELVQQLAGKIMSTQDGYIVIYDDYYLPDSSDVEAKVSVLDCKNLQVTELKTFSTEDRVFEGGMFLGLDNWVYLTQGGAKNHRVKASDLVIEEFLLESTRDLRGEYLSSFYQNENGIYRFFSSGRYKTKEISTTVEKYSGDNVSTVATSTANFMPDLYKQPENSSKLFAVSPTEFRDAMYFDMNTESFVEIEVVPGKGSLGYLIKSDYLIASNGIIYLKNGAIGADVTILNTACNDTNKCDFLFGSNPPTVVNHESYNFTTEQAIYIPIRAKDPDSDITSYKLSNAPNWLSIQNDVIVGRVPSDIESDIKDIILQVEDSKNNIIDHSFSLIYTAKKILIGQNEPIDSDGDGVLDTPDAFPLDPSETTDTDNDGIGNNEDKDDDNDGVSDSEDAFPLDSTETTDTDNDGIGNNADTDDDNDGVADSADAYPLDSSKSSNSNNSQPDTTSPSSGSEGGGSIGFLLVLLAYAICVSQVAKIRNNLY